LPEKMKKSPRFSSSAKKFTISKDYLHLRS